MTKKQKLAADKLQDAANRVLEAYRKYGPLGDEDALGRPSDFEAALDALMAAECEYRWAKKTKQEVLRDGHKHNATKAGVGKGHSHGQRLVKRSKG